MDQPVEALNWLPETVDRANFKDVESYIDELHAGFTHDLITQPCHCPRGGRRVRIANFAPLPNVVTKDREATFIHIITKEDFISGDRHGLLCMLKSPRVPWIAPLITNADKPQVTAWRNFNRKDTRLLVWLEEEGFLLVFRERATELILLTVVCQDREHNFEKLRKERAEYLKDHAPPL